MYFSQSNNCYYTSDRLVRIFYLVFCTFTVLGYSQFIWCIVLSMMMPLGFFIMHKLVDHRLVQGMRNNDIFANGLMGGIMQAPLPIPEILSQINRTSFKTGKFGLQANCAICWSDFQENEVVTPLICDERHLYHTTCIEAWIRKGNNTCPLCRNNIANI